MVEVLTIHAIVIDEFGGSEGVRDLGALEAAVFRPQTGYYKDAIAEAAALFESLIQNHPFIDGNKRTALGAADVHLRMNGFELGGDSMSHHRFVIEFDGDHGALLLHQLHFFDQQRVITWRDTEPANFRVAEVTQEQQLGPG